MGKDKEITRRLPRDGGKKARDSPNDAENRCSVVDKERKLLTSGARNAEMHQQRSDSNEANKLISCSHSGFKLNCARTSENACAKNTRRKNS